MTDTSFRAENPVCKYILLYLRILLCYCKLKGFEFMKPIGKENVELQVIRKKVDNNLKIKNLNIHIPNMEFEMKKMNYIISIN